MNTNLEFASCNTGDNTSVEVIGVSSDIASRIHIQCGRNCMIKIEGIRVCNSSIYILMNDEARLDIGPGQMFNGSVSFCLNEPSSITVGSDCLWGTCSLQTSDMHSIYSLETQQRINYAADIKIGNRVWLAQDALILKGADIADDVVVGARSLVLKGKYPPNSIIGGVPAKVIKANTFWNVSL